MIDLRAWKPTPISHTGSQKELARKRCFVSYPAELQPNRKNKNMIKSIGKITLAGILAAVVLGVPLKVSAQEKPKEKAAPEAAAPEAKNKPLPFKGKIGAVDKAAKTITLDEKTK